MPPPIAEGVDPFTDVELGDDPFTDKPPQPPEDPTLRAAFVQAQQKRNNAQIAKFQPGFFDGTAPGIMLKNMGSGLVQGALKVTGAANRLSGADAETPEDAEGGWGKGEFAAKQEETRQDNPYAVANEMRRKDKLPVLSGATAAIPQILAATATGSPTLAFGAMGVSQGAFDADEHNRNAAQIHKQADNILLYSKDPAERAAAQKMKADNPILTDMQKRMVAAGSGAINAGSAAIGKVLPNVFQRASALTSTVSPEVTQGLLQRAVTEGLTPEVLAARDAVVHEAAVKTLDNIIRAAPKEALKALGANELTNIAATSANAALQKVTMRPGMTADEYLKELQDSAESAVYMTLEFEVMHNAKQMAPAIRALNIKPPNFNFPVVNEYLQAQPPGETGGQQGRGGPELLEPPLKDANVPPKPPKGGGGATPAKPEFKDAWIKSAPEGPLQPVSENEPVRGGGKGSSPDQPPPVVQQEAATAPAGSQKSPLADVHENDLVQMADAGNQQAVAELEALAEKEHTAKTFNPANHPTAELKEIVQQAGEDAQTSTGKHREAAILVHDKAVQELQTREQTQLPPPEDVQPVEPQGEENPSQRPIDPRYLATTPEKNAGVKTAVEEKPSTSLKDLVEGAKSTGKLEIIPVDEHIVDANKKVESEAPKPEKRFDHIIWNANTVGVPEMGTKQKDWKRRVEDDRQIQAHIENVIQETGKLPEDFNDIFSIKEGTGPKGQKVASINWYEEPKAPTQPKYKEGDTVKVVYGGAGRKEEREAQVSRENEDGTYSVRLVQSGGKVSDPIRVKESEIIEGTAENIQTVPAKGESHDTGTGHNPKDGGRTPGPVVLDVPPRSTGVKTANDVQPDEKRPSLPAPGEPGTGIRRDGGDTGRRGGDQAVVPGQRGVAVVDEPVEGTPRLEGATEPAKPERAENHRIEAGDEIVPKGEMSRMDANIAAIKTLKQLEAENRHATPAEKQTLVQYSGWGSLPNAFDERAGDLNLTDSYRSYLQRNGQKDTLARMESLGRRQRELNALLTPEEKRAAESSTQYAHYTSKEVIKAMWDAAGHLGFAGGNVLEPAAGVGHFLGMAPAGTLHGIEKDSLSGRIMGKLYPQAKTFVSPYENVSIPSGSIDIAITNVPFSDTHPPESKAEQGMSLNLHNYFLARMLDHVRPGGLVIAITTSRTMDGPRDQRELLARKSELLGAIRLPNTAFKGSAGTEVTTDILFLRKPIGVTRIGETWTATAPVKTVLADGTPGPDAMVNEYYARHPEMMLGRPSMEGKMYGKQAEKKEFTLAPLPEYKDLGQAIKNAASNLPSAAMIAVQSAPPAIEVSGKLDTRRNGTMFEKDGVPTVVMAGKHVPATELVPELTPKQAKDYMKLRDAYREHITLQRSPDATDDMVDESIKNLRKLYDTLGGVEKQSDLFYYEPGINELRSLETSTTVPFGNKGQRRKVYVHSDVLKRRVLWPQRPPQKANDLADAIRVSQAWKGWIDPKYTAELLGKPEEQASADLEKSDLVFKDPESGQFVDREEYLSGNIRHKLAQARAAGIERNVTELQKVLPAPKSWEQIARPKSKKGEEVIAPPLGATWIPAETINEWLSHAFPAPYGRYSVAYERQLNKWIVTVPTRRGTADENTYAVHKTPSKVLEMRTRAKKENRALNEDEKAIIDSYLTRARDVMYYGSDVLDMLLNLKNPNPRVDGMLDEDATIATRNMMERLKREFRDWCDKNDGAKSQLTQIYNDVFNSHVDPNYDGTHLTFPDMSDEWARKLRPYQKNAIWRFLKTGHIMLAHVPGAGKTPLICAACHEASRIGLLKGKPVIAVLPPTASQFADTYKAMYPTDRLLVLPKGMTPEEANQKLAELKGGNWDAAIISHSVLDRIPNDPKREEQALMEQVNSWRDILLSEGKENGKKSKRFKEIQKKLDKIESRLTQVQADIKNRTKNVQFYWEELGIGMLTLDEAHMYKKPPFSTKLEKLTGLNLDWNPKSANLTLKVRDVQDRNNGRGIILATGTPITNTMAEAWHMLNLLSPQMVAEFGVPNFDDFMSTFASIEPELVQNAVGDYVNKIVVKRFTNGQVFSRLIRSGFDVVTRTMVKAQAADQAKRENDKSLEIPEPTTNTITVPMSDSGRDFFAKARKAYDEYARMSGNDKKMFQFISGLIFMSSRAASIDMQTIDTNTPDDPGNKLSQMANHVYSKWLDTMENRGTQVVFCDLINRFNASKLDRFLDPDERELMREEIRAKWAAAEAGEDGAKDDNEDDAEEEQPKIKGLKAPAKPKGEFLWDKIVRKLVERGIPRNQIAKISEFTTEAARQRLYDDVNEGRIRVVIGNTAKLGVGVNIQKRLVMGHHLDAPFMPSDMTQRNGRIVRSGNTYKDVSINMYGMRDTLDGANYGLLWRKEAMYEQMMDGTLNEDVFEDPGGAVTVSYEDAIAALTGNQDVKRRMELETLTRKLRSERSAIEAASNMAARDLENAQASAVKNEADKKNAEALLSYVRTNFDKPVFRQGDFKYATPDAFKGAIDEAVERTGEAAKKTNSSQNALFHVQPNASAERGISLSIQAYMREVYSGVHLGQGHRFELNYRTIVKVAADRDQEAETIYDGSASSSSFIYGLVEPSAVAKRLEDLVAKYDKWTAHQKERAQQLSAEGEKWTPEMDAALKAAEAELVAVKARIENPAPAPAPDAAAEAAKKADATIEKATDALASMGGFDPWGRFFRKKDADTQPAPRYDTPQPHIQTAIEAARRLPARGVLEYAADGILDAFYRVARRYRHLDKSKKIDAAVIDWFRHLPIMAHVIIDEASRRIASYLANLKPEQLELFSNAVVYEEALAGGYRGEKLRFDAKSLREIKEQRDHFMALAEKDLAVADAIKTRRAIIKQVVDKLIDIQELPESARDRAESYYHHQVLAFMDEYSASVGKKPSVKRQSFQKGRSLTEHIETLRLAEIIQNPKSTPDEVDDAKEKILDAHKDYIGTEYDYKTDVPIADTAFMRQALQLIMQWDAMEKLNEIAGIPIAELRRVAMGRNKLLVAQGIAAGQISEKEWNEVNARIGMMAAMLKEGEDNAEGPNFMRYASEIAADPTHPLRPAALGFFKAVHERNKWLRQTLLSRFEDWQKNIPEGYGLYQPKPGTAMYRALTLSDRMLEQIIANGTGEVTPGDFREVWAMGGPLTQYVLPEHIVAQLDEAQMPQNRSAAVKLLASGMTAIKMAMLFQPATVVGYQLRNQLSDIAVTLGPGGADIMKLVPESFRQLQKYYHPDTPHLSMSPELRAFRDHGGNAAMAEQDLDELSSQPAFTHAYEMKSKGLKRVGEAIKRGAEAPVRLNTLRENVLRFAAFMHYRNILNDAVAAWNKDNPTEMYLKPGNEMPVGAQRAAIKALEAAGGYAFSNPTIVQETLLHNGPDAAAGILSREQLGDYGALSPLGQWLRKWLVPFWSFQEMNVRRTAQGIVNAVNDHSGRSSILKNTGVKTAVGLLRAGITVAGIWAGTQAYNHLMHPDVEAALPPSERWTSHIDVGMDSGGNPLFLRNIDPFYEAGEWTGIPQTLAAVADNNPNPVKAGGIGILNKGVQTVGPVKAIPEILTGQSYYPDITKPRPASGWELAAGAVGMRPAYKDVKDLAEGRSPIDTVFHGHFLRLSPFPETYTDDSVISQAREVIGNWKARHGGRDPVFPASKTKGMRDATKKNDVAAFIRAKAEYVASGGDGNKFYDSIGRLDPLSSLSADNVQAMMKDVSAEDWAKVEAGRDVAKELRAKMLAWWRGEFVPKEKEKEETKAPR